MAETLRTIIISGSDQNENALELRSVLETGEVFEGTVTVAGLKAIKKMKKGKSDDEKLSFYVENQRTTAVFILTSAVLKRIVDDKKETAEAGIQISGENIQLRGSRLSKLLEDQKGKIVLMSCENDSNIPDCLEDIRDEIITVEPTAKGFEEKQVTIKTRLGVLNV